MGGLSSRGAEAARAPLGLRQAVHDLHLRAQHRHHQQLGDPVAGVDRVGLGAQIVQAHPKRAPVPLEKPTPLRTPMLLRLARMPTCPSGMATASPVGIRACAPPGMTTGSSMQAWRSTAAAPAVA